MTQYSTIFRSDFLAVIYQFNFPFKQDNQCVDFNQRMSSNLGATKHKSDKFYIDWTFPKNVSSITAFTKLNDKTYFSENRFLGYDKKNCY